MKELIISISFLALFSEVSFNDEYGKLEGYIGIYEGNCMPSFGVPPCEPSPISTTVYFTQPAEFFAYEQIMDSIVSDNSGYFIIDLPAGNYSLFLKDGDNIVCDWISCNSTCVCTPFTIYTDSVTVIKANLDHANW